MRFIKNKGIFIMDLQVILKFEPILPQFMAFE